MASSAGSRPETCDVHRPDRHARGHERPHLAVGVLDRGDGAHRGAQGAGHDFREHLAIEGRVDGADIRFAQFLIARVGPARAVRGHDRDEIRVGVVHDLQGIRLQQGRGIGCARRRQDEGGRRRRRWRCRPSGVRPRRRRGRARPRTWPCQRWPSGPPRTAGWPQTACGRCSSAGSSTPSMTNMNARVMRVTFSSMMGLHARTDESGPQPGPHQVPAYPRRTPWPLNEESQQHRPPLRPRSARDWTSPTTSTSQSSSP